MSQGLRILPDPIRSFGFGGLRIPGGSKSETYLEKVSRLLGANRLLYYPLNEPVGTSGAGSVLDESGNAANATPTGCTFGATGIGDGQTGVTLNGTSDKISSPNGSFNPDDLSISFWIKAPTGKNTNPPEKGILYHTADSAWNTGWGLYFTDENTVRFWVNQYATYKNTFDLPLDTWTHVTLMRISAATWQGGLGVLQVYLNGVKVGGDEDASATQVSPGSIPVVVGFAVGSGYGACELAHIAIANRRLTQAEITELASPT